MSCTDVCEIIKACGDNGVSRISFGGLKVIFGNNYADLEKAVTRDYVQSLETPHEIDDNVGIEDAELNLQELAYSDPERYERIMQGDIDA